MSNIPASLPPQNITGLGASPTTSLPVTTTRSTEDTAPYVSVPTQCLMGPPSREPFTGDSVAIHWCVPAGVQHDEVHSQPASSQPAEQS